MSIGESILALMGRQDPRQRLIQAVSQGTDTTSAPYAAPAAAPAGTDAPAGGAPATPPVAAAYKSPPDLAAMYADLTKYQSNANNIDRGIGLIGSAISQDGNRQATLNAFTGDSPAPIAPAGIAELAMNINKGRAAQASRAAQLAALPAIAQRYGLDLSTARELFETGKLDEVIANAEKPDRSAQKDGRGQVVTTDLKTGTQIGGAVGSPESSLSAIDGPDGSKYLFNKDKGTVGGQIVAPGSSLSAVEGPNGSKYLFDKSTGKIGKQLIPENADTTEVKNYNAAMGDYGMRNPGKEMDFPSFNDWMLQQHKAGASQTQVDMKAESAEKAKIGGYWGDQYTKIQDTGQAALGTLQNYDLIQKGLESGIKTGSLGEGEMAMRKLYAYLSPEDADNAEKVAGGELIQKIGNKMALLARNPESGMGMPGSLSDKDLAFLKDMQLGLGTTEAGNKLTLDVFRRMEQRKLDVAQEADQWVNEKGSMQGFSQHLRDWSKSNPLFDDIKVDNYVDKDPTAKRKAVLSKYGLDK